MAPRTAADHGAGMRRRRNRDSRRLDGAAAGGPHGGRVRSNPRQTQPRRSTHPHSLAVSAHDVARVRVDGHAERAQPIRRSRLRSCHVQPRLDTGRRAVGGSAGSKTRIARHRRLRLRNASRRGFAVAHTGSDAAPRGVPLPLRPCRGARESWTPPSSACFG